MIEFKQVTKRFTGQTEALSQVNFTLQPAEMLFLLGHSGAGKSTFLKLLALLDKPSSGAIHINGKSTAQYKPRDIAQFRQGLGIVFQSPHLLNDRTIFANVAMPLVLQGVDEALIKKRVHSALDKVGLLQRERAHPLQLSGGEQQRVGIARAIVHKPTLLIADEPTGNLDPELASQMMRLFEQFNQMGVAVVIATHNLGLIAGMKHRMLMLKGGCVC